MTTKDTTIDTLDIEYCTLEGRLVRDLRDHDMDWDTITLVIETLRHNPYYEHNYYDRNVVA